MASPWAQGFVEIADRCYVTRYREWDVTIGVVVGTAGALVVDTRASAVQGEQLRDDIARLPGRPDIAWVVNTHEHFDHVFGNAAFACATIHAHENAAAGMPAAAERTKQSIVADGGLDSELPAITSDVLQSVLATKLRLPDRTFSSASVIDLGDRYVELLHPGRGHTSGDLVLRVPDCGVMFAGDLVEESADREGTPYFGGDCWPLEWAPTLDFVISLLGSGSLVVPGHGAVVDRAFVEAQREDIAAVADLVRGLAVAGVPMAEALAVGEQAQRPAPLAEKYASDDAAGAEPRVVGGETGSGGSTVGWPFPVRYLDQAVARGYEHLGVVRPGLPLVSLPAKGGT